MYRGWHLSFECPIAIKCLKIPPHFTTEAKGQFFESFRKEGQLLNKLSNKHPSVVRVYDFGVTGTYAGTDAPYLVLEWLSGVDLATEMARRGRPYTEKEALLLLRPAVEAIAIAHGMNPAIAHRDLKPANLYLVRGDSDDSLKVLDFGIAKVMQEGDTATQLATRTSSGFSAFSPQYGAPEQFMSKRFGATGPWTDVHALGLIMVEMVTGHSALEGETPYEYAHAAMSGERPTPRSRGARVSEGMERLCAKALSLHPRDRYGNAQEMLTAMDEVLRGARGQRGKRESRAKEAMDRVAATSLGVETYVPGSHPQGSSTTMPVSHSVGAAEPVEVGQGTVFGDQVRTYVPDTLEASGQEKVAKKVRGKLSNKWAIAGIGGAGVVGIVAMLMMAIGEKGEKKKGVETPVVVASAENEPRLEPASPEPQPSKPAPAVKRCPEATSLPSGYVCIEPGTFVMGSPASEKGRSNNEDQHRVTLTRAFMMKATEVTQGEWESLMGDNPSYFKACGGSCPVEQVSWYEAIAYANALSKKEGLEICYRDGEKEYDKSSASSKTEPRWPKGLDCLGYRLPTEAEWEYAARAGTTTAFYTGDITEPTGRDANLDRAGWYEENSDRKTHPVGQKAANGGGLYDMHGNVWEWVWDRYRDYGQGEQRDPLGAQTGVSRVLRGGSWYYFARHCRSAFRYYYSPDYRFNYLGFRLCRSIP